MKKEESFKKRYFNPNNYFFMNGEPHKVLQKNHGADILVAWNYIEEKTVTYSLSQARKMMEKAFVTGQVERMVNRTRVAMLSYIKDGHIRAPYLTHALQGTRRKVCYIWSEQDVLDLHDMLLTRSRGRPRSDGRPIVNQLPSKAELMAMMRNDAVLYTKTKDGGFQPVWQAQDW